MVEKSDSSPPPPTLIFLIAKNVFIVLMVLVVGFVLYFIFSKINYKELLPFLRIRPEAAHNSFQPLTPPTGELEQSLLQLVNNFKK
jgi:hypothetical protein